MMTLRNFSRLTLTFCVTTTVGAANADGLGDAIHSCRGAPSAVDKVAACTFVISRVSDDGALLKAYNRRGLANVELGRYPEAVRDFSAVIRLNPKVAGYYDNRQNAFRQLGRLDEALSDANAAVRLAPGYTFVFRSRAMVYDEWADRTSRSAITLMPSRWTSTTQASGAIEPSSMLRSAATAMPSSI